MSRSILRSVLELRTPMTRLPPAFLLPMQTVAQRSLTTTSRRLADSQEAAAPAPIIEPQTSASPAPLYPKQPQAKTSLPSEAAETISQLLPLLRAQPAHYITAHVWGRPYLVTAGDQIRLPFKMPGVLPGDVLRLDRASVLGSRDYTLKGDPYVDERLFECRAIVLGTESEPLREKVKTKRRQRRNKTVKSKHRYTILRISELSIKGPEALGL
ncbi:ribosomal protein L21-like protein [Xylariales sp. PMI_506]|nr:ribosomal protein L21-like protein [Xylariales sp. PMI_506]